MNQNTSSAVMQQRKEPHDSLDFFPTPPWATRALCEWLKAQDLPMPLSEMDVLEPACGEGHMARPLAEYFNSVWPMDVHPYGFGEVWDFLMPYTRPQPAWIITNPPFRLAEQFIEQSSKIAFFGWAMLVRIAFLESVGRYQNLFSKNPPSDILQFTERVPMHKGRLVKEGTTATAYCWLVWRFAPGLSGTRFHWIPPCRKRLERPEDYEAKE